MQTAQLEALYSAHHGWLRAWLRRKLGDVHHAADLAHDTFVRVLRVQDGGGGSPQAPSDEVLREPRAYLTTVARRLMLNHWRRASLEAAWLETLATLPERCAPPPEDRLMILQTLHDIDAALDGLAPKARRAFLLSQMDGLTYAQIGIELGVTDRTVKRYMAQAFEACLTLVD